MWSKALLALAYFDRTLQLLPQEMLGKGISAAETLKEIFENNEQVTGCSCHVRRVE